jgi:hypothetical protein
MHVASSAKSFTTPSHVFKDFSNKNMIQGRITIRAPLLELSFRLIVYSTLSLRFSETDSVKLYVKLRVM